MKLSRSAPAAADPRPLKAISRPAAVTLDGEDGMHDEADVDAEVGELGEDRIDQKRHVVIDDLEHRIGSRRRETARHRPRRVESNFRRAGLAHLEERPGIRRQAGKMTRVVAHEVFGHRIGENARR